MIWGAYTMMRGAERDISGNFRCKLRIGAKRIARKESPSAVSDYEDLFRVTNRYC